MEANKDSARESMFLEDWINIYFSIYGSVSGQNHPSVFRPATLLIPEHLRNLQAAQQNTTRHILPDHALDSARDSSKVRTTYKSPLWDPFM